MAVFLVFGTIFPVLVLLSFEINVLAVFDDNLVCSRNHRPDYIKRRVIRTKRHYFISRCFHVTHKQMAG